MNTRPHLSLPLVVLCPVLLPCVLLDNGQTHWTTPNQGPIEEFQIIVDAMLALLYPTLAKDDARPASKAFRSGTIVSGFAMSAPNLSYFGCSFVSFP